MKRFLFAALLVVTISAVAVMPAFAMESCSMDMTGMSDPTVASLVMHVQHASMPMSGMAAHIDPALVQALLAPLNTAANTTVSLPGRAGALQAFILLVNAQAGKGIDATCASHLVQQAQSIVLG